VVTLLIHGVLDPLTTYLAVAVFETGIETNYWLAGYFQQGVGAVILIHVPLYLLVITSYLSFTWLFIRATPQVATRIYWLAVGCFVLLILWGIVVVGNNVSVLLLGL
jgi:hypothetical protein